MTLYLMEIIGKVLRCQAKFVCVYIIVSLKLLYLKTYTLTNRLYYRSWRFFRSRSWQMFPSDYTFFAPGIWACAYSPPLCVVCGPRRLSAPCWMHPSRKHLTAPSAVVRTAGNSLSTPVSRCTLTWLLLERSSFSTTRKRQWKSIMR